MRRGVLGVVLVVLAVTVAAPANGEPGSPLDLHGPITVGGTITYRAPCSVPAGAQLDLMLGSHDPQPYYLTVTRRGPVHEGQLVHGEVPHGAMPGSWNAWLRCPTGELFERPFRFRPVAGGPGPTPPPVIRPVRSRVDVERYSGWSMIGQHIAGEITAIADTGTTTDDYGFVLAGADGGVFTYGAASYLGSAADLQLAAPIVDVVGDGRTQGYWLAGADGGVFAFGVPFFGSAAGAPHAGTVTAIVPTRSGAGYWLVTDAGAVLSFGDAPFHGAPAELQAPIVDAAPARDGYVLLGSDGSVHAFGGPSYGDAVGTFADRDPAVAIVAGEDGYRVYSASGDSQPFGPTPPTGPQRDSAATIRRVIDASLAASTAPSWLLVVR